MRIDLARALLAGRLAESFGAGIMTAQTVLGVWFFMMPLVGAGVAGLGLSTAFPLISLVRHWGYAAALGLIYPVEDAPELSAEAPQTAEVTP